MGIPHASVLALPLFFASLALCTPALSASAGQASPSLRPSLPSSIRITLSKQVPSAIRLEAKQAPLAQILKRLTAKTGVKIHYSSLPSDLITATCAEASVKAVVECLLGPGSNLAAKMPEKNAKLTQTLNPGAQAQAAELWILSAPSRIVHTDALTAKSDPGQTTPALAAKSKKETVADRDHDQWEETLKQAASKTPKNGRPRSTTWACRGKPTIPM